jgi:outer membrane murein-binding lipoprotein Lpp
MLELFMLATGFAGGYVASVYSWPVVKIRINGLSAEVANLRAKAQQLENRIRGR